jgi:four helix bundle protein
VSGRSYRDLIAWQKAMDLVTGVYTVSAGWPKEEQFGLVNQARRAAVSIPANIAEGQGRRGDKEFLRFLLIAHGSLFELETHLLIAQRLTYTSDALAAPLLQQTAEIGRLLNGLIAELRSRLRS